MIWQAAGAWPEIPANERKMPSGRL